MKFLLYTLIVGGAFAGLNTLQKPTAEFIRSNGLLTSNDGPKIIGGDDAIPNELPWQVSIQVKPIFGDRYHNCGGTLMDATHIITAAHCIEGQTLSQMSIVAGAHNIKESESTQQIRYPKRLIWNDNFDSYLLTHDVGVITVSEPFLLNEFVQPLKIAAEGVEPSGECINSGWGNSNPTGGTPLVLPDALQKVTLEMISRSNCSVAYDGINIVDETMVCARGLKPFSNQGAYV
jgi:secreted trypsin-like serine protease